MHGLRCTGKFSIDFLRTLSLFAALQMKCSDGEILLASDYAPYWFADHIWTGLTATCTDGFNGAQMQLEAPLVRNSVTILLELKKCSNLKFFTASMCSPFLK